MEYIRDTYGVPAKRGGRVEYRGGAEIQTGTITGSDGHYLRIRMDGEKHSRDYHPAWAMRFLDDTSKGGATPTTQEE